MRLSAPLVSTESSLATVGAKVKTGVCFYFFYEKFLYFEAICMIQPQKAEVRRRPSLVPSNTCRLRSLSIILAFTDIHPRKRTMSSTYTVPTVYSSTNLGPMITSVKFPEDCLSKLWNMRTPGLIESEIYSPLTQGCAISSCCPSSTPYSYSYEWLSTYYSPAVCPQSWRPCPGPPSGHIS